MALNLGLLSCGGDSDPPTPSEGEGPIPITEAIGEAETEEAVASVSTEEESFRLAFDVTVTARAITDSTSAQDRCLPSPRALGEDLSAADRLAQEAREYPYKEAFALDYQAIREAHPDDARQRFYLALYREQLLKIMEAESNLSILAQDRSFERAVSFTHGFFQEYDFYQGVRRIHESQRAILRGETDKSLEMMSVLLVKTAVELDRIEEKEREIEEAILAVQVSQSLDDTLVTENELIQGTLQDDPFINSREGLEDNLVEMMEMALYFKNELFVEAPWAVILFNTIHQGLWEKPLRTRLSDLYDIAFPTPGPPLATEDITLRWKALYQMALPSITEAAAQALDDITHRLRRNLVLFGDDDRFHVLLQHNLLVESTLDSLEEVGDDEAIHAYVQEVEGYDINHPRDITINETLRNAVNGLWEGILNPNLLVSTILPCLAPGYTGLVACLALPVVEGIADNATIKRDFFQGATFGLNSFALYEATAFPKDSKIFLERFSVAVLLTVFKAKGILFKVRPPWTSPSLRAGRATPSAQVQASQSNIFHRMSPRSFVDYLRGKDYRLSFVAVGTSLATLLVAEAFIVGETHSFGDPQFYQKVFLNPDFLKTALLLVAIDFIYVFRAVNLRHGVWSRQYFETMSRTAGEAFIASVLIQGIFHGVRGEDLDRIDVGRSFFESVYVSVFSLGKTKALIAAMNSFSTSGLATGLVGRYGFLESPLAKRSGESMAFLMSNFFG